MNQTPEEIMAEYLAVLATLRGEDVAQESRIDYEKGWYYVSEGTRLRDGSIDVPTPASCFHKRQMLQRIAQLQEQANLRVNAKKES